MGDSLYEPELQDPVTTSIPVRRRPTSVEVVFSQPRHPQRLTEAVFYPFAYRLMYLSRRLEEQLFELFQKGYVKGTVTISIGNEATTVGMSLPFRPGRDIVSLLHRDFGAHLLFGATPYQLVCQYFANADSPTHGREGNVHHGDAARRRFPMISHLGNMLSTVVGGTWAARRNGEQVFGLAVIGDGGTSTGDFHESLNLASVLGVPVLFLVENNHYSFSTPTEYQYRCRQLSDRAQGYGIEGRTIDGTDAWAVYSAVCDALEVMQDNSLPFILECSSIRLHGHAAYDKATYVGAEEQERNRRRDPLPRTRGLLQDVCGMAEEEIVALETEVDDEVQEAIADALKVRRPSPATEGGAVFCPRSRSAAPPYRASRVKNGDAVRRALEYILEHNPRAYLAGLDIGIYGSAFKTCKGLIERFGRERVIDMPLCESGLTGFALGASQTGCEGIIEYQFADFSTEAVTQLGLNAGTWYYRSGNPAPIVVRLPCGGGLTMGAFHSGEYEGLWSQFPGLKLLYPATAQETFEALVGGFHDANPSLIFEHKLLYWSRAGDIDFDGDLAALWRSRRYTEGSEATVVAIGAMVFEALAAAQERSGAVEVWNPFVLQPLDAAPIMESVRRTGRLLVVQECGQAQGIGHRIISLAAQHCAGSLKCPPRLLAAPDTPVPFAPELEMHGRPNSKAVSACLDEMLRTS